MGSGELPVIKKWDDYKVLDETADMLARLALGANDGDPHKDPRYPRLSQFPTRRRVESLVRLALTPVPDGEPGYQRGIELKVLCSATWERVDADPGEDEGAKSLLAIAYDRILEDEPAMGVIEAAVKHFASAAIEDNSLWLQFAQAAYPDHPQTPGSEGWMEAEAKGNPHESVDNPFLR